MQDLNMPMENPAPQNPTPQPYRKTMNKLLLAIIIALPFVLVIGVVFWYFVLYQKPTSESPGTTAKPTPSTGFGNLSPYASLCKEFQKTESKISCEKAIELALANSPGKVQKVSIEPIRASAFSSSSTIETQTIDVWMIDIMLTSPYFDRAFQKETQLLRIGIRLDDPNGIYKKPLE